jgi:uncharacterized protein DUF1416
MTDGCGAPAQTVTLPDSVDLTKETVIAGTVTGDDGNPVGGAYVRLLDGTGEFTAEVVTSDAGAFRFFAAPGTWTVRALSRNGNGETPVSAEVGLNEVGINVAR